MLQTTAGRIVFGTLLFSLLSVNVTWASEEIIVPKKVFSFHSFEAWHGGHAGQDLKLLTFVETTCPQEARRILVEHVGDGRAIIDRVFIPAEGETRITLRADAATWSVELRDVSDLKVTIEEPSQYDASLIWQQRLFFEEDYRLTRSLHQDGKKLAHIVSTIRDEALLERLYTELDQGKAEAIAASMPPEVARLMMTLESILASRIGKGSPLSNVRPLLHSLFAALHAYAPPSGVSLARATWKPEPLGGGGGVQPVHGPIRDFVSSFESVENVQDPMAGIHGPPDGGCPDGKVGSAE
jgi:hypothetical protein